MKPVRPQFSFEKLARADAKLPRPRRLSTIAPVDFSAFPSDLSGAYGRSRRQLVLRPGEAGVIAGALASAGAGDTILLHGGTYQEGASNDDAALRITRPGIVLRALPGQRARVVPRAPTSKRGIVISASNVLVHGLDLDGFAAAGVAIGRQGATVGGVIISDVTIKTSSQRGWVDGVVVWPDNRGAGKPASDGLLLRNVIIEGATLGINCGTGPCRSWWLENVRIKNRKGDGEGSDGFAVERGHNIVALNLEVSGASADGLDLNATGVLVWGARVHHVGGRGIHLRQGGDLINSVIQHTGGAALQLRKGRYRLLHSVLAFQRPGGGAQAVLQAIPDAADTAEVQLVNSIFLETGPLRLARSVELSVDGCLFHGTRGRLLLEAHRGGRRLRIPTRRAARALRRAGLGKHNRQGDPRFVNAAAGDFRLQRSSPAVDAGRKVTPFPAHDLAGTARLKGSAPDLGPHESF